ncbi:cytochrome P450 89A9-like [Miscanthus floridulus]|uniref:cytochrome P450 89A9-like n=1 Tax=Miscanthus floridulus TaxID=154761 RepID=UPI00345AE83E
MAKLRHGRKWRRFLAFRSRQAALFVPHIEARRRQMSGYHGGGDGGDVRRPYVDLLIEHRFPDENHPPAKRTLTEDEMVSLMVELFGVAEATVTALEWTLAHLVNQTEVQAKQRHELAGDHGGDNDGSVSVSDKKPTGGSTYLHAVVLECLRLCTRHIPAGHARGPFRGRGGWHSNRNTVPAGGMRVQFILADIGKDKKLWTDPDEFRPERFLPGGEGEDVDLVPAELKEIKMMPFGAGQKACPGAAMGAQFIKAFLAPLVREFEWAAALPAVGEEGSGGTADGGVDMTEQYGFVTVMKSPLRVHISPCA